MKKTQGYYIKGNFITRGYFQQTLLKNDLTRYFAYVVESFVASCLMFFYKLFSSSFKKKYKYGISICCIFKNESKFLDEWIKYHLALGIDHFYLYNNNSDDDFLSILEPYLNKGLIDLVYWPDQHAQMATYEDCYNKNKNETNWLVFIDIDEFICPLEQESIKNWLFNYRHYPSVAVYWKQFGSNGKLIHDYDSLVIEQYTQCWPKLSVFTKMFCNMDFPIIEFENPHVLYSRIYGVKVPPINQFKKIVTRGFHRSSRTKKPNVQINHYWGKAYDCFVENKINRTDVYHKNDREIAQSRKNLLASHESMCLTRDFSIQRFLLATKLGSELY